MLLPAAIILFLIILPFAVTGWLFAPWIPISNEELERLGKVLRLKSEDVFYELGCGDGRVVRYVAKKFGCQSVGVELNPFLYVICLLRPAKNTKYILGDLFEQNIQNADCVYLFGLPRALNNRVRAKLEKELPAKAQVVCYGFPMEGWKPQLVDKVPRKLPIFIYRHRSLP